MASLNTVQGLLDTITAGLGVRGVTGATLQDIVFSLASPSGVMHLSAPGTTFVGTGGFAQFDLWEGSVDTKGLQDLLGSGEGSYLIKPNGAGDWMVELYLRCTVNTTGNYRMRPRHLLAGGGDESFLLIDRTDASAGDEITLKVKMLKEGLADGDKVVMQLYAPLGALVTPLYGYFSMERK